MKVNIKVEEGQMVYCLWHPKKKATSWTGHLHLQGKSFHVGYCTELCINSGKKGIPQMCEGCSGSFLRTQKKRGKK